jgi:hypothetical protein
MIYLATGLMVVWFAGLLFLTGQALNDIRLVLNDLAPDARYSDFASGFKIIVSKINPARLTRCRPTASKKSDPTSTDHVRMGRWRSHSTRMFPFLYSGVRHRSLNTLTHSSARPLRSDDLSDKGANPTQFSRRLDSQFDGSSCCVLPE